MKKLLLIFFAIPSIIFGQNQFIKIKDDCSIFWELEKDPSISFEWSGLCKNGKADGKGILKRLKKYPNVEPILHSSIECTMLEGRIEGNAKLEWINSTYFKTLEGVWRKGFITTGKLTFYSHQHDGKKTYLYDGELKKLYMKNGNGRVTDENNKVIQEGEFKDDIFIKGSYNYLTSNGKFNSNANKLDSLPIISLGTIAIDKDANNIVKYKASPNGNYFAIATKDDIIYIYSIKSKELLYTFTDLYEKTASKTGNGQRSVQSMISSTTRLTNPFPSFEFTSNENFFYAYDGTTAYIFDLNKGELFFNRDVYLQPDFTKISIDEKKILQLYSNGFRASLIFPAPNAQVPTIKEFKYSEVIKKRIKEISVGVIYRFICSNSYNYSAFTTDATNYEIYNNKTGELLRKINVGNLQKCALSDNYFLSIGTIAENNVISVFDIKNNKAIGEIHPMFFNRKVYSNYILTTSNDEKYLFITSKYPETNGYIEIYDLENLTCILRLKNEKITSLDINYIKNEIIYSEGNKLYAIKLPFKIESKLLENEDFWNKY